MRRSGWRNGSIIIRPNFPAASSSASRSPARSRPIPPSIVADEPTGNLDEATGREIIELLFRGHRERGTTLVLVTHDTELAARCDRVLQMHSGRLDAAMPHEAK